jgi:hypothetical protein
MHILRGFPMINLQKEIKCLREKLFKLNLTKKHKNINGNWLSFVYSKPRTSCQSPGFTKFEE